MTSPDGTSSTVPASPTPSSECAEESRLAQPPDTIPLPPTTSSPTVSPPPSTRNLPALILALFGMVLGFLLASSPAQNSDLWSHLATGRALIQGHLPSSSDPWLDAPTPPLQTSRYLYGLMLYGTYQLVGGAGVVLGKALLAGVLALLLWRAGKGQHGTVLAGVGTMLTLLILAPWMGLRPELFSFLGLTTLVIGLDQQVQRGEAKTPAAWWWIPVLIMVWANLDHWVVLGPIATALFALGAWLKGWSRGARSVAILVPVTFLASLCSPAHITVWLASPWLGGIDTTPSLPALVDPATWFREGRLASVIACYLAIILGLIGLRLDWKGRSWAWAPLWTSLLGLSVWNSAYLPFFALVAGPLAALGWSEWLARDLPNLARKRGAGLARGTAVVAGLLLVLAAWPGWLQGRPYGGRTWSIRGEDSLREAVAQVAHRQQKGLLARGLSFSHAFGDYHRWFQPESTPFTNPLPEITAHELAILRHGLLGDPDAEPSRETEKLDRDWRAVLRRRQINHLILHQEEDQSITRAVYRLAANSDEWELLALRGRTIIFGWHDPAQPMATSQLAKLRLDLTRRALDPSPQDQAPEGWSGRGPGRAWWLDPLEPMLFPPPDRDEATLYLTYFDAQIPRIKRQNQVVWQHGLTAGLVGCSFGPYANPGVLSVDLAYRLSGIAGGWRLLTLLDDDGPLPVALLAVRAARRALAANPDDAQSYFVLGEAYLRLARDTRERAWARRFPPLADYRLAQAIGAFSQALQLRSDLPQIHGRLGRAYRDQGKLDLTLEQLNRLIETTRAQGPPGKGSVEETFRESLAALEAERDALQKEVNKRQDLATESSETRRVFDLARDANMRGLPALALKTLLRSDTSEFGTEGAELELDLLLLCGRLREVHAWLEPQLEQTLGVLPFRQFRARFDAVTGNYAEARQDLELIATILRQTPTPGWTLRDYLAVTISRALFQPPILDRNPALLWQSVYNGMRLLEDVQRRSANLVQEANTNVLIGLLALEEGRIPEAKHAFRQALAVWKSPAVAATGGGLDFPGRTVAQQCLQLLGETDSAN